MDTLPNGARHVVNVPPDGGGVPKWTLQEELRLGNADGSGAAGFGQVKDLKVTSDGRIVVLETLADEIRVFSPSGEHLATFGGKGEGPGELRQPLGLMLDAHGRLWVPDVGNTRMSVFDPAKGLLWSYPMHLMRLSWVWDGVMMADGRIVKQSLTLGPPRRDLLRVWNDSMRLVDSIFLPPPPSDDRGNPPGMFVVSRGAGRLTISVPFYNSGAITLDPWGGVWSTRAGDPSYRIVHWMPKDGDTTLVLETRRTPIAVTSANRAGAIAGVRKALARFNVEDVDWSKIPATKAAVTSMFLSADRELWVATPTADGHTLYDRYDHTGRYLGTVSTDLKPRYGVTPVVRGDHLWAVITDSLDVPYVVRERIVPK